MASNIIQYSPLVSDDFEDHKSDIEPLTSAPPSPKLGTVIGVFVPCVLSIFGAILFLRLGWAVGQAGIYGVMGMFLVSGITVTLTALSVSAISTNGSMRGGGVYYMVSRSLGPELGVSVGLIFYLANAVAFAFYMIAFAENLVETLDMEPQWRGISTMNMIGSVGLALALCASLLGSSFFSKLNLYILAALAFSIFSIFLSLTHPALASHSSPSGYTGIRIDTYRTNERSHYTHPYTYGKVFSVVFPAMTGVMAGANLSGDLKDPGRSIGPGTLSAIGVAMSVYISLAVMIAMAITSDVLCDDYQILQQVCFSSWVVVLGVWASTISSALGSLVGGARILQAIARDNVIPGLSMFGAGTGKGDEPWVALLLTWLLAQCCMFANLNMVAAIITNFFLLTYLSTNLACFIFTVSGAPNFRPLFRYFSWHTALAGALLCLVVMFVCDALYASLSIGCMILGVCWVTYTAPVTPWGDVKQALIFHQVRKYLLRLDQRKEHPKFWRPSVLLLVRRTHTHIHTLIDFCNNIKKGGLYIIGDVMVGDVRTDEQRHGYMETQQLWLTLIDSMKVKAFSEVMISQSWAEGARALVIGCGLGGMRPNTVCMSIDFSSTLRTHTQGPPPEALVALSRIRALRDDLTMTPSDPCYDAGPQEWDDIENLSKGEKCVELLGTANMSQGSADEGMAKIFNEIGEVIQTCLALSKHVLLTRNFDRLSLAEIRSFRKMHAYTHTPRHTHIQPKANGMSIDVCVDLRDNADIHALMCSRDDESVCIDSTVSLQLQLAHVLHRCDVWETHTHIRVLCAVTDTSTEEYAHTAIKNLLRTIRIRATIVVLNVSEEGGHDDASIFNDFLRKNTISTAVAFVGLKRAMVEALTHPHTHTHIHARRHAHTHTHEVLSYIHALTKDLPPVLVCIPGSSSSIVTTAL